MTANQSKALSALLTHSTRQEAAAAAGISDRTIRSYLSNPEFLAEYHAAFSSLVEDATQQAKQLISPALDVLREIMQDTNESSPARITAAKAAIDFALRLIDAVEVQQRLNDIEHYIEVVETA